jgi:ligand-binding sensor domain-containing protein
MISGEHWMKHVDLRGKSLLTMVADSEFVWVASSSGIFRLDQQTKRINDLWFEKMFDHILYMTWN